MIFLMISNGFFFLGQCGCSGYRQSLYSKFSSGVSRYRYRCKGNVEAYPGVNVAEHRAEAFPGDNVVGVDNLL